MHTPATITEASTSLGVHDFEPAVLYGARTANDHPATGHDLVRAEARAAQPFLAVRDALGYYQPATVEQILEAARQAIEQKMPQGSPMSSTAAIKDYLRAKLAGCEREVFAVLFFDAQHRILKYAEMFQGTINATAVYPREVVREGLRLNASAVILSHNHPSGSPDPSHADRSLTQRLRTALELVDIRTLDHIIVAGNRTVSFSENGLM